MDWTAEASRDTMQLEQEPCCDRPDVPKHSSVKSSYHVALVSFSTLPLDKTTSHPHTEFVSSEEDTQ